jgi:hypothetical protein
MTKYHIKWTLRAKALKNSDHQMKQVKQHSRETHKENSYYKYSEKFIQLKYPS